MNLNDLTYDGDTRTVGEILAEHPEVLEDGMTDYLVLTERRGELESLQVTTEYELDLVESELSYLGGERGKDNDEARAKRIANRCENLVDHHLTLLQMRRYISDELKCISAELDDE